MTRTEWGIGIVFTGVILVSAWLSSAEFTLSVCQRFLDFERNIAGMTFGVTGIWLALMLPKEVVQRLAGKKLPPQMDSAEQKAIDTLFLPLKVATGILVLTSLADFMIPVAKSAILRHHLNRETFRQIGFVAVLTIGLVQVYSLAYVIYPILKLKDGQAKRAVADEVGTMFQGSTVTPEGLAQSKSKATPHIVDADDAT